MSNLPPGVTDRMIEDPYGNAAEYDACENLIEQQEPAVAALAEALHGKLSEMGYDRLDEAIDEAQRAFDELVKAGWTLTHGQKEGPDAA